MASPHAAKQRHKLSERKRPRVFLDISINDVPTGQLIIELCPDIVGKTSENFRVLCSGEKGLCSGGQRLWYRGCKFHRIVPNFVCQSGDFMSNDGTGGESVYGKPFVDESFELKHKGPGVLSMVNSGPDSNQSQFFITFCKVEMLDDAHVVFGYIVEGLDVLRAIEKCGTACGKPTKEVVIAHCGVLGYTH